MLEYIFNISHEKYSVFILFRKRYEEWFGYGKLNVFLSNKCLTFKFYNKCK